MGHANVEEYTKTYTAFSGCDIVASFNGVVIGELQALTYSISREKAPIYTMGNAEPRSFSRGKRGIAGSLVFTVFNRDALLEEFNDKFKNPSSKVQKFAANDLSKDQPYMSIDKWDEEMSGLVNSNVPTNGGTFGDVSSLLVKTTPKYADEILPFDITVTFANEYGQKAVLTIYGVELLNEGAGYSIDSVSTEKAYTFVARRIDHMKPVDDNIPAQFSATF